SPGASSSRPTSVATQPPYGSASTSRVDIPRRAKASASPMATVVRPGAPAGPHTAKTTPGPGAGPAVLGARPAIASAARTAVTVARGLLEVLSGWRPPSQLSRWTSAQLQYDLERRAPRRPTGQRQQLLRVRLTEASPGVAEACALTKDLVRDRVRVMAMRM